MPATQSIVQKTELGGCAIQANWSITKALANNQEHQRSTDDTIVQEIPAMVSKKNIVW